MLRLIWVGVAGVVVTVASGCADEGSSSGTDDTDPSTGSADASGVTGTPSTDGPTTASTTSAPSTATSDPVDTTQGDSESSATTSGCGTQCDSDEDAIAVAVGYGTRRVMSADGVEWTGFVEIDPAGGDDENLLRGVGYGGGAFVAVGGAGQGLSLVSFDGVEWVYEDRTHSSFLSDAVWFDDGFVAAGGNGYRVRSSDDGESWEETGGYFAGHFRDLVAGSDRVVAVGHTYGGNDMGLWSSTVDGVTWSDEQTGGAPLSSVAYGAGVFVAVGNGGRVMSSSDGQRWTDAELGLSGTEGVFFGDGQFHVAADSSYWTSTDGEAWSQTKVPDARGIAAELHGAFLTTSWPAAVLRSSRLGTWETVFQVEGSGLTDIAVGPPRAELR